MENLPEQIMNGLQLGFVYALIALGYTIVYGIIKIINFAHSDVFMAGAFVGFYGFTLFAAYGWMTLPLSILMAVVVCTVLRVTIERVAYRPLRYAPKIATLISALGGSFSLSTSAALKWFSVPITGWLLHRLRKYRCCISVQ